MGGSKVAGAGRAARREPSGAQPRGSDGTLLTHEEDDVPIPCFGGGAYALLTTVPALAEASVGACPTALATTWGSCNGVCTQSGDKVTCDPTTIGACDPSSSPTAAAYWALTDQSTGDTSVFGSCTAGTTKTFCCGLDDSGGGSNAINELEFQMIDLASLDEYLYLTDGSDFLDQFPSSDPLAVLVAGNAGDDTINGSSALTGYSEELSGGAGEDTINGGPGSDKIEGGDDADTLTGDDGDDTINGGAGADTIESLLGNDEIDGGSGADDIDGGFGDDEISGGAGDDIILGNVGNDDIDGCCVA